MVVCMITLAQMLTCCSAVSDRVVVGTLKTALQQEYHACVPLGWDPVPVLGHYYPGYSSEYFENGVWLRPFWIGVVYDNQQRDPRVRAAEAVMDALIRVGMLQRTSGRGATFYHLTPAAVRYYYDGNSYGDNPDHLPFLCYSSVLPTKVIRTGPILRRSFRVTFEWRSSSPAPWADDSFLRSHSVLLPPLVTPTFAQFSKSQGQWYVQRIWTTQPMLGRTVEPSAWPPDSTDTARALPSAH